VDGVLGGVISHSLVGASPDFQDRFFKLLPGYFDPYQLRTDRWAHWPSSPAFQYVNVHCQHHAGFCMWDTATTSFA